MTTGLPWYFGTYREIVDKVRTGTGPAAGDRAQAMWLQAQDVLTQCDQVIGTAVAGADESWSGRAAGSFQTAMTPVSSWVSGAVDDAITTTDTVVAQGHAAGELRRLLPPEPHGVNPYGMALYYKTATEDAQRLAVGYAGHTASNRRKLDLWSFPPGVTVDVPSPVTAGLARVGVAGVGGGPGAGPGPGGPGPVGGGAAGPAPGEVGGFVPAPAPVLPRGTGGGPSGDGAGATPGAGAGGPGPVPAGGRAGGGPNPDSGAGAGPGGTGPGAAGGTGTGFGVPGGGETGTGFGGGGGSGRGGGSGGTGDAAFGGPGRGGPGAVVDGGPATRGGDTGRVIGGYGGVDNLPPGGGGRGVRPPQPGLSPPATPTWRDLVAAQPPAEQAATRGGTGALYPPPMLGGVAGSSERGHRRARYLVDDSGAFTDHRWFAPAVIGPNS